MKRCESAEGIGNGRFEASSSVRNNDNKNRMMVQLPDSPTSGLGSLSLHERDREQQCSATTTFVHVDTCNFREVVQKLTGASDNDGVEKFPITLSLSSRQAARGAAGTATAGTEKLADSTCRGLIPRPVGDLSARRKPAFKLHERRQSFLLRKLDVKGLGLASGLRRGSGGYGSGMCSPTSELSPRFNPSLMPSPVTPLTTNVFENNACSNTCEATTPTCYDVCTMYLRPKETPTQKLEEGGTGGRSAESREGHFFLHSSPILERPRQLPELLTLFPLTSPRASEPS